MFNSEKLKHLSKENEVIQSRNDLNDEAYRNLGKMSLKQKDELKAIQYYAKAVQLNPYHIESYNQLGLLYCKQNKYEQGKKCFEQIIKLNQADVCTYQNLGTLYYWQKNYQRSIKLLRQALNLSSQNDELYRKLGVSYLALNDLIKAKICFNNAIKLNSTNSEAYRNLGDVFCRQKQNIKTIECYEKAVQLNSSDSLAHKQLGLLYYFQGRNSDAEEQFAQAIQISRDHPFYMLKHAHILAQMNQIAQAFYQLKRFHFKYEIKTSVNIQERQKIKTNYKLSTNTINWILKRMRYFEKMQKIYQQKYFMNSAGQDKLNEILIKFFKTLWKIQDKSNIFIKLLQDINDQQLEIKIKQINQANCLNDIKEQQKYKKLISKAPRMERYFKRLITCLCFSIDLFRQISQQIKISGATTVNYSIEKYISYLKDQLKPTKISLTEGYVPIVLAIASYCLKIQIKQASSYLANIFSTGSDFFNQIIQFLLILTRHQKFIKLIANSQLYSLPWYESIKGKINFFINQKELVDRHRTSNFNTYQFDKQQNMAIEHCIQVLITALKAYKQNRINGVNLQKLAKLCLQQISYRSVQNKQNMRQNTKNQCCTIW